MCEDEGTIGGDGLAEAARVGVGGKGRGDREMLGRTRLSLGGG